MILLAAGLLLAETAAATVVRIPLIRDPSGVPIQCILDPNCHIRFHPAIPPVASADPADTVVFETRDAFDNQFDFGTIPADVAVADASRVHPLTGPLFVNGGAPGDILEVALVGIAPGPDNLRDIARWKLTQAAVTSPDMPGIRVPFNGFPGTIGVAPTAAFGPHPKAPTGIGEGVGQQRSLFSSPPCSEESPSCEP